MADDKSKSDSTKLPSGAGTEAGVSGTLIYNGIITGVEYNRKLTGMSGNHQYEIMRRSDSTIRGALQVVKLPVLSTTWDVKAAEVEGVVTDEAKSKAAFVKRELMGRNVNWFHFIRELMTCLDFGHSVAEKVYELTEFEGKTRIGLKKMAFRRQESIYKWETDDHKPGITQFVGADRRNIIREKLLVATFDQEGDNYLGTSLLRYVYKDWDIKDKLTLVNAMALEKLGIGVPVVKEREGQTMTPQDEQLAVDALMNMRANQKSYLKLPNTADVEMLDLKGHTTKDIIPTLNYHDARIMKSILAGFLELGGASGSGSQSLSTDLTSLFMKSEEALAKIIQAAVMEDLVKQLCDFNYTDMSEGYPQLTYGQIADDDLSKLASAISEITNAGLLTPDAEIEDHIRKIYRLPLMTKEQKDQYEEKHQPVDQVQVDKNGDPIDPKKQPTDPNKAKKDTKNLKKKDDKKDIEATLEGARDYRAKLIGALAGA